MKLCPFLMPNYLPNKQIDLEDLQCQEEGCAWWDKSGEDCAILSLSIELSYLSAFLRGLEK